MLHIQILIHAVTRALREFSLGQTPVMQAEVRKRNFQILIDAISWTNSIILRVEESKATSKEVKAMKTIQISLNSIDKVKSFVNDITKFDYDFDLVSGRYVIDAKSIMGIFSLDLSKPIDLNIHAEENVEDVLAALAPYIL